METGPGPIPSWTMARATSGWIPTMTETAPRSRAISAMLRSVLNPNESITSKSGDVNDDPAGPVPADLVDQVAAEAQHLGVVEGSVDRRDQEQALPQDRDQRRSGAHVVVAPSLQVIAYPEQSLGLLQPP